MSHVPSHPIVKSATNLGVDKMDPQTTALGSTAAASAAVSGAVSTSNDQLGGASHTPDNTEPNSPAQVSLALRRGGEPFVY